jgi:HopA1 effector protein family
MIQNTLEDTLKQIIDGLEINPSGQIIVNGNPQMADYLFIPTSENKNVQIRKMLNDLIYEHFYCQNSANEGDKATEKEFIKSLRKANHSRNRLRDGFKVLYADLDGSIVVEKNHQRKRVNGGMYLRKQANGTESQVGEIVKIYSHNEWLSSENAFYHVFGETLDIDFPEALVRFYFHLQPEGSSILIQKLSSILNEQKIFFQFKCLKNPKDYTRADAGVLYMYKFDWKEFYPVLNTIFEEITPFLKEETPLFSYQIRKGIGFGENPKDATKSFGMLRCELIADAMFEAFDVKKPKSEWVKHILNYLQNKGYRIDTFYLNPNSSFDYLF